MDKVLLLGANSFSGRHFKDFVRRNRLWDQFLLIGADRQETDADPCDKMEYLQIKVQDHAALEHMLIAEKPDFIINLIGTFCEEDYMNYFHVNASLTGRMLDSIVKNKLTVKKILVIGSAAEYGDVQELPVNENAATNPVSLYGISKLMQTHISRYYFKRYDINLNVARTFNIIGEGISNKLAVGNFMEQIHHAKNGDSIRTGNLSPKRDYLQIHDVIEAYWKILMKGHAGEIYNVCSGKSISMQEIVTYLIRRSGKTLDVMMDERYLKAMDISEIYGDNTKLRMHTDWQCADDVFQRL